MTHDLLQSDIELAMRLMTDGRADDQIITALVQRRLDPAKAARLMDDLRNGRKVIAQPALPPEFTLRRSRSKRAERETRPSSPPRSVKSQPRPEPSPASAATGRKRPPVVWVVTAILLFLAIVVIGSILFLHYQPGSGPARAQAPGAPGTSVEPASRVSAVGTANPSRDASPAALALDLRPDGLRIRGQLVTRDNLLATVVSLFGLPDRTNQLRQTGTLIYAYDHHGLLIYSQPAGGTNSLVLDCDAIGGTNGTTSPFTGTLAVEDYVIDPNTDSQALVVMKQLGLGAPKASGPIWNGRYKDVGLVFAYLKSLRRPSLIQLDLK